MPDQMHINNSSFEPFVVCLVVFEYTVGNFLTVFVKGRGRPLFCLSGRATILGIFQCTTPDPKSLGTKDPAASSQVK
jgi:hypothetical protein